MEQFIVQYDFPLGVGEFAVQMRHEVGRDFAVGSPSDIILEAVRQLDDTGSETLFIASTDPAYRVEISYMVAQVGYTLGAAVLGFVGKQHIEWP